MLVVHLNFAELNKMAGHIQKQARMASDAAELKRLLLSCGWSVRQVALRVGASEAAGARWVAGAEAVPPEVLAWLRAVASALEAAPPPQLPTLRRPRGRPRGGSYVLEMLRWAGRPMSVREMCNLAPQFGREVLSMTMRQNLERLSATGQAVKLEGDLITYSLPDAK